MQRFAKLFVVALVVGGFASTAQASFTRVHTLGEGGRYFKDESGVRLYPQLVAEFADQFGLDVCKATNKTFVKPLDPVLSEISGHLHLNTYWGIVLGVWASDYNDTLASLFAEGFDLATGKIPFDPAGAAANRSWDIFLGRAFDWGSVGLHILYGSATYDRSPAWTEVSPFDADIDRESDAFKVHELGLQFGGSLKFSRITLDAALKYGAHGYAYKPDMVSFPGSLGTGNEIEFVTRANWVLSSRWAIVPMFYVNTGSISGTQTRASSDASSLDPEFEVHRAASMLNLEFGVAVMLTPMAGMTVYIAPAIEYSKLDEKTTVDEVMDKTTVSTFALPSIRSGIEYQILDWMVLRAAFVKLIEDKTTKTVHDDPDGKTVVTTEYSLVPKIGNQAPQAAYYYTLGLGLTFQHFFLDFELDPGYLARGPYVLSGAGAPMFLQASATWTF